MIDDLKRAAQRATKGDFLEPMATDEERATLAGMKPPIEDAQVQDYVVWRRSLLLLAATLFSLGFLLEVVGFQSAEDQIAEPYLAQTKKQAKAMGRSVSESEEKQIRETIVKGFGEDNFETLDTWGYLMILATLVAAVLAWLGSSRWADVKASRRFARTAWYVFVGTPLLLAIIPWSQMLDFKHVGAAAEQLRSGMAMYLALKVVITIAPKLVSIFPGLMRSGMTLKTLFHESATPAYVTTMAAPVFAMFMLIIFSTVIQMEGTITVFLGVGFLLGSAAVYLVRSRELLRSHTKEEATKTVKEVRRLAGMLSGLGILMLAVFLFDSETISFVTALNLFVIAGGNLLLTMVVASDFLLAVLDKEYRLAKDFQGSKFAGAYEKKMATLAAAGLTELRTVPTAAPKEES